MSRFSRAALASRPAGLSAARHIVLVGGQSNIINRNALDPLIDTADARVEQWSKAAQQIIAQGDPLLHPDPVAAGPGPGMTFGKAYAAARSSRVLLVPVGYGGTSLVGSTPTWQLGGRDRENAVTQANAAIAAAQAAYPGSSVRAILWIQGESDADAGITQAAYQPALWALFQDFRDRITGAADVPIVLGQMLPEAIAANVVFSTGAAGATYPDIDAAHTALGTRMRRCTKVAIGTGYAKPESPAVVHYNAAGGRAMGSAMYGGLATAEAAEGDAAPAAVTLTLGATGQSSQVLSYTSSAEALDYVAEYKRSVDSTWIRFADGISTGLSITVTGLTPGTSYDYRVVPRGYGGSGGVSNTVTATTATNSTTALRLTQIQPTATPKLVESVNGSSEYLYTIPAGASAPTPATDRAGVSSHKLPANTAGGFIFEIDPVHFTNGSTNYSSLLCEVRKTNANTDAFNSGATTGCIWGVQHHASTGNTWRMISNGSGTSLAATTPLVAAGADRVKIERDAAGLWKAYIARAASPDTWVEYYTYAVTYTGEVYPAISGASAGTAPARTHGPVRGINVVAV